MPRTPIFTRLQSIMMGCAACWVLALVVSLPLMEDGPARVLMGGSLALADVIALLACLIRSRRFPEEAVSWRLIAFAMLAAVVANVLIAARTNHNPLFLDTVTIALYLCATFALPWALLLLPMATRQPEGFRIHLAGGMLFGCSLALLLWMVGLWQAVGDQTWLSRGLMIALCLKVALPGGIVAYQMVDDPKRLNGPLTWVFLSLSLGSLPGLLAIHQTEYNKFSIPAAAGMTIIAPLAIALAGFHPNPADGPQEYRRINRTLIHGLLYLPFLGASLCLFIALRHLTFLGIPALGFLVVSSLMVIHQFLLLREVQCSRDELDLRVHDRTLALEEAQDILLRTERMNSLGMIGAGLAHDLNNTFSVILLSLEAVKCGQQEGVIRGEAGLDRIEKAAKHGASLGQRLMQFARQETEDLLPLDLAQFLKEDQDLLRLLLPARIRLWVEPTKEPFPVLGSRGLIQQMLVNLVSNAGDAIVGAGSIHIRLSRGWFEGGREFALLAVEDDGTGIPAEVLEKIFQPLFTTKPSGKGTGLGLASVKAIMERMQGSVQVCSVPGTSTIFSLRFPLRTGTDPETIK